MQNVLSASLIVPEILTVPTLFRATSLKSPQVEIS